MCNHLILAVVGVTTSGALGTMTFIDFNDLPDRQGVVANFYASRGVTSMTFVSPEVGYWHDGLMASYPSYPLPGEGLGLSSYRNLAGYLGDFQLTFAQPIALLTVDAMRAAGAFTVSGYSGTTLVATVSFGEDASRNWQPVRLQSALNARFTRVVFDVENLIPEGPNRIYGPDVFDNLMFDTVPDPGGVVALMIAGVPWVIGRRRPVDA